MFSMFEWMTRTRLDSPKELSNSILRIFLDWVISVPVHVYVQQALVPHMEVAVSALTHIKQTPSVFCASSHNLIGLESLKTRLPMLKQVMALTIALKA